MAHSTSTVSFEDIEAARERIRDAILETPCRVGDWISKQTGAEVHLKLENLQHTGAFKSRGALHRLLHLTEEERKRGVVAASAGNHAQGVAYHATRLGIPSTIVMPVGTPLVKVTRTAGYGAGVLLEGENYDAAFEKARSISEERGAVLIHAYDDDLVIAGQGTLGLEILEQDPDVDTILIPVGGGGLAAGVGLAMKHIKPHVRIIGVEPAALPSMQRAVEAGHPVTLDPATTIADGIAVRRVGDRTSAICREVVDEWVTVTDDEIATAILFLLEKEKIVAEGAGAAGVAALLADKVGDVEGQNVVALVCGGNIDVNVLSRIIDRGLVESGRLARLELTMPDRPGALALLLGRVGALRANVVEVHHERAFSTASLGHVAVQLRIETRGPEHIQELTEDLSSAGYEVTRQW